MAMFFCVDSLGGGVQGLYNVDMEGLHSCWGVILLLIRRQMASQPKVDLPHAVLSGVVGRHGCEDLTNLAEVLLNRSLLDRLPLRVNKASADTLEENLEEDNGFLNVLEVGGDLQPAAEAPPLVPGGGVFIEDGGRGPLSDCLLCSMVVSCCLHQYGRGGRHQGLLCGQCVQK